MGAADGMTGMLTQSEAADLLYREALLLDRGEWEAWVALYADDCVFWMPAWTSEGVPTSDPERELSLIYYQGRHNLEDRVWRAQSGLSVASTPRPRVVHAVTNVLVEAADTERATVGSSFTVHRFDVRSGLTHVFFGRYEHQLRVAAGGWRIAAKKILLLNDVIPAVVDFYSV
jgi:benzoate/toluate 1,2-dioxygenase subunit beta